MTVPTTGAKGNKPSTRPNRVRAAPISSVPDLTEPRAARKLSLAERTLPSGLRVVAVRKPGVPIVEVRLRIPFLGTGPAHPARAAVLSDTLLTGAGPYDRAGLAAAVQSAGADVTVGVDADRLMISANTLAATFPQLLALLSLVLTEATYPASEVSAERSRLTERLSVARSRAGVIASERLAARIFGAHPYALDLPQADAVADTTAVHVRRLHRERVRPDGAVLVVVGDISPSRVLDQAEAALSSWTGARATVRTPALPAVTAAPTLIVDRAGSVQSSVRMAAPALTRTDDDYPALQLANLIFGGYFSSRWNENIREDKGYTYGPHSRIEHNVLGSTLMFDVEVASEVTGPAMLETFYELGRIASLPVTQAELDNVRQYAIGTLALSTATQAGLASTISGLSAFGLGLDWVRDHPARLARLSVEQVSAAAARFLAPSSLSTVVVGDAAMITAPLAALGAVES